MAYSYTAFTGNGSTTQYAVSFPYIRREHVAVTVAGVPSTFTWINNSLIQMDAAPAAAAAVRVYRTTPIDAPLADFVDGATLVAADLDTNSRQSIYIQQELDDAQTDNLPNVIPNGNKGDITTTVGGTVWAINNGAVLEAKIATGAVTEAKLGTGAVTSAKILDGTIVNADVNASAGITADKLAFAQTGTGAVARTVDSRLKDTVSVLDFIPVAEHAAIRAGTSTYDCTTNIQSAIASGTSITVLFPVGIYKITSTIDLSSTNVALIGENIFTSCPKITGNFNGYLIKLAGTSISDYRGPDLISGLQFENLNNGTAAGSAGCIDSRYTGNVIIRNCYLRFQNTGIYCAETISAEFDNVFLNGDSGTNTTHSNCRGYYGQGRNCKITQGRVYGCFVALDISGDSWNVSGLNCEFDDIIIRQGAANCFLFEGCHFETSGMLFTNAVTFPTITTSPWTDNGGDGTGWTGSTTFLNCNVAFGAVGAGNGQAAPMLVIKNQAGFTGSLNLIGCAFNCGTPTLATASASFNRTVATSIPAGLKSFIVGDSNFVDPATIPSDQYSNYARFGGSTYGGQVQLNRLKLDGFISDVSGNNAYKLTGFTQFRLTDTSAIIDETDGTCVKGYTTASLKSTFYSQGVRMAWANFTPTVDNQCSLGSSSLRWTQVFAASATINTSDRNSKTEIQATPLGLDFINSLKPSRFKMLESGNVTPGEEETYFDEDGNQLKRIKVGSQQSIPGVRFHDGFISQEVKESLDSFGIDGAMWTQDENGRQGLRYEELIAPLAKAVQELSQEIEALKLQLSFK